MEVDKSLLVTQNQLKLLIGILLEDSKYPEDILKAGPHPSIQTLVKLADLIYTKKIPGETDADYGARILPGKVKDLAEDGWKLLISVNNTNYSNGYFGAAFVHTGLQQVVVAHRGTDPKCFGALYTDIQGILRTKYTTCMNSAVTFVDFIRQAIYSANHQHRQYTLAITGHSLGAWLAQITSFSVKYLAIKQVDSKICFEKKPEGGIHAKTVGFDSPGARDMLDRVLDDYYDRYERNVLLDGLDITVYLSAPNRINTCGVHLGKIYRVFNDISEYEDMLTDLLYVSDGSIQYTIATHGMSYFIIALIIDESGKIGEVTDWAKNSQEFHKLFEILNWDNNFHLEVDNPNDLTKFHRYKVAKLESPENVSIIFNSSFRVFSEVELQMLFRMHILQEQKSELTILNEFIKNNKLKVESSKLLPKFVLDHYKRTITCESGESLVELCKRLKQLMRWLKPQFTQAVEEQIKVFNQAADLIYYAEGQSYLDSLPKCCLDFMGTDGFKKFLVSGKTQVLCLVTSSNDVVFQMSRLRNILHQMERSNDSSKSSIKYICKNHYTFVRQSQLQNLIKNFGWPVEKKFLMMVDCTLSSLTSILQLIEDVYKKNVKSLKLVLIVSQSIDTPDSSEFCKTIKFNSDVLFSDLTPDSQNKMFNRSNVINFGGKKYSFERFLGEERSVCKINQILSSEYLKNFATIENYTINIEDTRPSLSDIQMPFFKLNIKTSMEFFVSCVKSPNTNILVVLSGLNREDLETGADWHQLKGMDIIIAEGDAQLSFRDTCNKHQDKCIYLFEVSGRDVYCKEVFNKRFYLDRKFLHRAYIDVEEFARTEPEDLFVINSETNKKLLLALINFTNKKAFTDNILIEPIEEEVNVNQKYIHKRIHFVKICHSKESYKLEWRYSNGSIKSLLPFMSTDSCEPINEIDLSKTERNLTIITDEPGMGKTTTLLSLSRLMDSPWVIYIELKSFQRHIDCKLSQTLTHKSVANFLLSECGSQAVGLLEYLLESKINSKRVVLMLDGFDELDDYVKDKDKESAKRNIIRLLIFLKNIPTVQIFLTTRKYLKRSLEKELFSLCTSFVPFNKEEQLNFLVTIWRSCLSLELGYYGEEEEARLEEYAKKVLQRANRVLGPEINCIMGVPLQLRMLAEVFRPTSDLLLNSPEVLLKQFNIESASNLYKKFISLKYEIYLNDKTSLGAAADELIIKLFTDSITTMHCELGFKAFFPDFYIKHFDAIEHRWLNKLNRIGLLQTKGVGDFQFVHRTYAEYCCAQMVIRLLNQPKSSRYEFFKEIIVPQILLHRGCKIIRVFLNMLLNETTMSETALELNAKCISRLWNRDSSIFRNQEHQTILHIAVQENNEYIVTLLLNIFSDDEAFVSLIQQNNQYNNTAMNFLKKPRQQDIFEGELVLDTITTNILQRIKVCSDETQEKVFLAILFNRKVSTFFETPNKFFFERLFNQHIFEFQLAIEQEYPFILNNLFYNVILKYVGCPLKIFNRVEEVESEIIPFRKAVENNNVKLVEKIMYKKLKNNVERYCLVLMKSNDQEMQTVLHLAAGRGHLDIVRKLLKDQTAVPFTVLMAQRDIRKMTPLHRASWAGRLNITKYLAECGADVNTRGKDGESVLMSAAMGGELLIVEYLVERGADIHARDGDSKSVLMYAAMSGELLTVQYIVERGLDVHARDGNGRTVLYHAARRGHLPIVEYLLQQNLDPDRVDRVRGTALTVASLWEKWDIVRLLLERGVDVNADRGEALTHAIRWGEWSIVETLVSKGAAVKKSHIHNNLSEFKVKYPNYEFKKE